ncbi:MAG: hypothetical protein ACLRVN_06945 [Butyricicoccus sp.]
MITPSCDEILKLAKEYTTIPVCREIYADMTTPISLLRRLQIRSDRFFLLESVEGGEKWARYSFLGYDPILRATCKNGTVTLEGAVNKTVKTDKPLTVLREVLGEYRAPRLEGQPPFTAFVGYFAYAMLGYAEPTLKIKRGAWDDLTMLFDKVIAYDHLKRSRARGQHGHAYGELRQSMCGARGYGGADQRPEPASAAQGNRQAELHLQRHRGAVRRYRGKDP